jgi:tetratricopeptide (TPR) repeat protein
LAVLKMTLSRICKYICPQTTLLLLLILLSSPAAVRANDQVGVLVGNAQIYSKQGNYPKAIKSFDKAMKLRPNDLALHYERASMSGRAGYFMNAIKDYTYVINQDGLSGGGIFSHAPRFRADCYMAIGNYQGAIQDYNTFLRGAPGDGKVWSYMAEALSLSFRNDLALAAIRRGLATESHWSKRLKVLQRQIMTGEKIKPHKPLSN